MDYYTTTDQKLESLLQKIKQYDKQIDNLEKVVLMLSEKLAEVTKYIQDNDHKIRGQLKLMYSCPGEDSPRPLREVLDSLHERLNMLELESPSDN